MHIKLGPRSCLLRGMGFRFVLVALALVPGLTSCTAGVEVAITKKCADRAEEQNTEERWRETAREKGLDDGQFAAFMTEEVRKEGMAYDWATCMMDAEFRCEPITAEGPPERCEGENVTANNPFLEEDESS